MSKQAKNLGLPVFPWWTRVAWTPEQMRARSKSGAPEFVRRVQLSHAVGATGLIEALEAADEALNRLAAYTGISVVAHTWGLYKGPVPLSVRRYDDWRLKSSFVPDGYKLVAKVANITPVVKLDKGDELWQQVCDKINAFGRDPNISGPKLGNIDVDQVGFHEVQTPDGVTSLRATILDIDPIFDPASWPREK